MLTIDDVAAYALGLPKVEEGLRFRHRTWFVRGKSFAWERPYSKADIRRFGTEVPPDEPLLAVNVADLHEKAAVLAAAPVGFFTIEHFANYPALLISLPVADPDAVREALVDAWLCTAPTALAEEYLATGR